MGGHGTKRCQRFRPNYDIVIDGKDVAKEYSVRGRLRVKGIKKALDYLHLHSGFSNPVAMVPEGFICDDPVMMDKLLRERRVMVAQANTRHKFPHEHNLIDYANRNGIPIVSNNIFRKWSDKKKGRGGEHELDNVYWVPYAFIKRSFLPNPKPSKLNDKKGYAPKLLKEHPCPRCRSK